MKHHKLAPTDFCRDRSKRLPNVFVQMLQFRLRWYRQTMLNKLIRFKHALILLIGIFVPSAGMLITLLTQPILTIIKPTVINEHYFITVFGVYLFYLCWISLQKDAITPPSIKHYFQSLPINKTILYFIDSLILIAANNILWIPFAIILATQRDLTPMVYLRCSILMLSILTLQLVWLMCKFNFNLGIKLKISQWSLKYFPLLTLQYLVLFRQHLLKFLSRLILACAAIGFGFGVIILGNTVNAVSCAMIVTSVIMLALSGLFPALSESRASMMAYYHSLPCNKLTWYLLDYFVLSLSSLILSAGFISILLFEHKMNGLSALLACVMIFPLGGILCYTQNYFSRQGTLVSTLVLASYLMVVLSYVRDL